MPRVAGFLVIAVALFLMGGSYSDVDASPLGTPSSLPAPLQQTCLPDGTVRVTFGWVPGYGGQQWLDISLSDNGFAPGTYVGVGPFAPGVGSFAWNGLLPGKVHTARVNTHSTFQWESSAKSVFVTHNCAFSSPALIAPIEPEACDAATFNWAPANPDGVVQWLDLSTVNNGFAPGTFVSVGPLGPNTSTFFWTGLRPGASHYWRVNTWTGSTWTSSATGSFTTPCGAASGGGRNRCHPSYANVCLGIGIGDYDCAGGSGNGPNYVRGPVVVVGPDVFDLDRDGDGIGCE